MCVCVCSGSVSGGEEEEGPGVADFNRADQKLGGRWHQNPRSCSPHVPFHSPHAELSGTHQNLQTSETTPWDPLSDPHFISESLRLIDLTCQKTPAYTQGCWVWVTTKEYVKKVLCLFFRSQTNVSSSSSLTLCSFSLPAWGWVGSSIRYVGSTWWSLYKYA